jgi:diguanylate cyclase (GGDEF)-like protein/PAS domain S-box-containing protein/hemerythrin-like metal-binding protein
MIRGTILVVDGHLASLSMLRDTLLHEGLQVLPADSTEKALAALDTTQPDLILMALETGSRDGLEALRQLKSRPAGQDIPVLFLCAATDAGSKAQAFDLGAVDCVNQPFERHELLARIRAHLELSRLRAELKRHSEEQLLQSERMLLAAIVESSGDAIIARDLGGAVTSWNKAAHRIFGYASDDMIGRSIAALIPPERHEEAAMIPDRVRDGKLICDFETERLRKDGTRITVSLTASPIRDISGQTIGVSSIVRDITAQRQTEQALRESEQLWKFALEGSGEGVWDWDVETGEASYSRRWKEMLGYSENDIGNHVQAWEQLVHPDDLAGALTAIQAYQNGTIPDYIVEHRLKCRDGRWRWILSRGMIVSRTADGKPQRMIGTHADITERKEAELQINFMAYHDRLTGLPNRSLFFDRLSHAISHARRNNNKVALLFADLDGFKPVNDLLGHDAGDIVLKVVAARLLACVRAIDTVARIGGDEFVVILGELETAGEAAQVASKLVEAIAPAITLPGGQTCRVGLSIDISIYPNHGTEMDTLLAAADAAMYQSKTGGKGQYTVFSNTSDIPMVRDNWTYFDDTHKVGVAQIDEQHHQLATMINELNRAIRDRDSDARIKHLFLELTDFTIYHFATEHELMERYHYPGQASHDAIHGRLMADTLHFRSRLNKGGDLFVLQSLKDWLMQHIEAEDKTLGEFLKGKI